MARLIILYGHPADPEAFEEYYARRHIPFASGHMPGALLPHLPVGVREPGRAARGLRD